MLPEQDGFHVCRDIRRHSAVPIIMLTARGDVTDRVVGLEIGADDYMPKPFEPRELVARVQNVLRRTAPREGREEHGRLRFKDLDINLERRTVELESSPLELTTMEYQLLVLFASNPGRTYTRDEILNELRGIDAQLFSRSVDILVSRLRQKLQDTTRHPRFIRTVWGTGYTFVGAEPDQP
jgi:OmpR family response regulator RpaB